MATKQTAPKKETNLIRRVSVKPANKSIQAFGSGDTVNVFVKVKEGEKERVQLYKGVVTKIQGSGAQKNFHSSQNFCGCGC